jgi:hypothetical protein
MDEGDAIEHQIRSKAVCLGSGEQCPICGADNTCRVAKGHLYKGSCWCHGVVVPANLLRHLAEEYAEEACLCPTCLEMVARLAAEHSNVETVISEIRRTLQPPATNEDFYMENGNVVFTAAYHLKRGTCCKNGCRHCPY